MSAPDADDRRIVTRRTALRTTASAAVTTIAVSGAGTAAAQETTTTSDVRPDYGSWLDDVDGGYMDARGQEEVTVQVGASGNGGAFAFQPAGLWVDPGTTVIWQWTGQGGAHNVHAVEGAGFVSGDPVSDGSQTFEHVFEEAGIVEYQCDPHVSLGMKGSVAVGDDVPTASASFGAEGGGGGSWLPGDEFARIFIPMTFGVVGLAGLLAFSSEIYDGLNRAGRFVSGRSEAEPPVVTEAPREEVAHEIGHDEFDPVGTGSLIILYFVILAVLWVFMYFIEFLGNGPSVVG